MVKVILLIKKRPDLTRAEFMDYYSNKHVPFMHRLLSKGAAVHRRNFVVPTGEAATHANVDASGSDDYDAICEVFYEDRETAESVLKDFADPEVRRQTEQDESNFILPGSIKRYVVEVHETVYRPLPDTSGS